MGYADRSLSTGERITYRTRRHAVGALLGAHWAILAIGSATALFALGGNLDPDGLSGSFRQSIGWLTALMFFVGLAGFAWTGLRLVNDEYVLTDRRIIKVEGVLNRTAMDSALEKIDEAVVRQSGLGRMLDYGDLAVVTSPAGGIGRMRTVRKPTAFKKRLLDARHDNEVDRQRASWPTSPPIREGAAAPAPSDGTGTAGAGASPPVAPPVVKAHPDEIARRLAGLADLRGSGAITPEEYEAKKVQLLARL